LQGSPEDLVLSGQFAHTFEKQNVIFDTKTGSFTLDTTPSRAVALRASGLAWIWTKRALERAGFQVLDAPIPDIPVVEVLGVGSETTWVLHDGNIRASHTSIYSLLQALKEIPREPQSLRFPNRT
jgi:iron complex transport system ATP-binding protein